MLYAIFCYDNEDVVGAWTKEQDDGVMAKLEVVQQKLAAQGRRAGAGCRSSPTRTGGRTRRTTPRPSPSTSAI